MSFVGGPWRATANLVRERVFTMLYHFGRERVFTMLYHFDETCYLRCLLLSLVFWLRDSIWVIVIWTLTLTRWFSSLLCSLHAYTLAYTCTYCYYCSILYFMVLTKLAPVQSPFLSFFLSWVSKTQPNHWTKRMASTPAISLLQYQCVLLWLIKTILENCYGPGVIPLQGTWGARILTLHLNYVAV